MQNKLLARAHEVAIAICSQNDDVKGVELFGSLARNETNNSSDIDMIILVSEDAYQAWVEACDFDDWENPYTAAKHERAFSAEEVLKLNLPWTQYGLDIFLFPSDWRGQLDKLQEEGRHHDPLFMRNICADARKIA